MGTLASQAAIGVWVQEPGGGTYFHSPAEISTGTESDAVIGRALCNLGHMVTAYSSILLA